MQNSQQVSQTWQNVGTKGHTFPMIMILLIILVITHGNWAEKKIDTEKKIGLTGGLTFFILKSKKGVKHVFSGHG
jgi:hypothetical protein